MKYCILIATFTLCTWCQGQCNTDRHNTSLESGWISCTPAPNPNTLRPPGHWILYDFTFDYAIEQLHFWNYNHPGNLTQGAQDIVIDLSDDGFNWTQAATYTLPMASGSPDYNGVDGPLLSQRGRYMLITILSNYGGICSAISEIRIGVADEIDCLQSLSLSGNLGNKKYHAVNSIEAAGTVEINQTVHLQAGLEVTLNQGFQSAHTAELQIEIDPCNN